MHSQFCLSTQQFFCKVLNLTFRSRGTGIHLQSSSLEDLVPQHLMATSFALTLKGFRKHLHKRYTPWFFTRLFFPDVLLLCVWNTNFNMFISAFTAYFHQLCPLVHFSHSQKKLHFETFFPLRKTPAVSVAEMTSALSGFKGHHSPASILFSIFCYYSALYLSTVLTPSC